MKLFKYNHTWDFGHEVALRFFSFKDRDVFRIELDHSEYSNILEPNIRFGITLFTPSSLFSIYFDAWNVEITFYIGTVFWWDEDE